MTDGDARVDGSWSAQAHICAQTIGPAALYIIRVRCHEHYEGGRIKTIVRRADAAFSLLPVCRSRRPSCGYATPRPRRAVAAAVYRADRADVDATTLDGKVLCGYQGWFNTPGDGTDFGFTHWGQGLDRPGGGRFTVDMWPDVVGVRPEGPARGPGPEDARRLAGPALQRLPQGAGAAALQVDAAVRDRRRLPQPVRRRGDQPAPGAYTSTRSWPTSARGATARGGSGR